MPADLVKLSKTISHALRHQPELYGLQLDGEGWTGLPQLVTALQKKGWKDLQPEAIFAALGQAEKKRFQISDGKIRAYYGHSTPEKIVKQQQVPPAVLYHGTSTTSVSSILHKGLLPMSRQYVHLSEDTATALTVARRRKQTGLTVLTIQALHAHENGVAFYREENGIWLSETIPPAYIS